MIIIQMTIMIIIEEFLDINKIRSMQIMMFY